MSWWICWTFAWISYAAIWCYQLVILAFGAFYYRRTHSNARAILSSTLRHPSTFHLSRNHRYGWQRKRERFALLPAQDGSVEMQEFRRKQLAFSSYESCSLQDVPTSIFVSVPMSSRKKTLCFVLPLHSSFGSLLKLIRARCGFKLKTTSSFKIVSPASSKAFRPLFSSASSLFSTSLHRLGITPNSEIRFSIRVLGGAESTSRDEEYYEVEYDGVFDGLSEEGLAALERNAVASTSRAPLVPQKRSASEKEKI